MSYHAISYHTGVCENNTPPDMKTGWQISFENTEPGTGLQFLLLRRMAKARAKGVFFTYPILVLPQKKCSSGIFS